MEKLKEFKKELSDLLKKYNAEIGFYVNDSSDTYGLSGEKMVIYFDNGRCNDNYHTINNEWSFDSNDLKY